MYVLDAIIRRKKQNAATLEIEEASILHVISTVLSSTQCKETISERTSIANITYLNKSLRYTHAIDSRQITFTAFSLFQSRPNMNLVPTEIEASSPFAVTGNSGDLSPRMQTNQAPSNNEDLQGSSTMLSDSGDLNQKHILDGSLKTDGPDLKKVQMQPHAPVEKLKTDPRGDKSAVKKKRSRKKWKKPKGKPNRPLSAYNLFFQSERAAMLGEDGKTQEQDKNKKRIHRKTHGKVGFAEMARVIGQKWKGLPEDDRKPFVEQAAKEKERYAVELKTWQSQQEAKNAKSKLAKLKEESQAAMDESNSSSTGVLASGAALREDSLRLQQMMQERRNFSLLQQGSDQDYIRALQERQLALYGAYPSAAEASANAILQQFQNGMPGAAASLGGMNPMGMGTAGMPGMNPLRQMYPMGRMSAAAELQQQMGASGVPFEVAAAEHQRLQQLRGGGASGPAGASMEAAMAGMGSNAGSGGNQAGNDLGLLQQQFSSQYPGGDAMAAVMMRRLQQGNRYNM